MVARRNFYAAIQSAKQQAIAQYGDDAMAMEAIGLARRSERKRGKRRNDEVSGRNCTLPLHGPPRKQNAPG